jgi:hypothetical protein
LCWFSALRASLPRGVSLAPAYLKEFYERIKQKKGAGKAIIATARKFLGIIYRTLKYNWVFADFANFVLAED